MSFMRGREPNQSSAMMLKKIWSLRSTSAEKPTAASPAPNPTIAARTIGAAWGDRSTLLARISRKRISERSAVGVILNTC